MKLRTIALHLTAPALLGSLPLHAAITQTFEVGESTANWGAGSAWDGGFVENAGGFLDSSVGGSNAGSDTSANQNTKRDFKNNTDGLDVKTDIYSVSLYVRFDQFSVGSGGTVKFSFIDGAYGGNSAGDMQIVSDGGVLKAQARNGSGFEDLGLNVELNVPYLLELMVNPAGGTYSASISEVDIFGNISQSNPTRTLSGLPIGSNVINNNANGTITFHLEASNANITYRVDNINITAVPEPSAALLGLFCGFGFALRRRR